MRVTSLEGKIECSFAFLGKQVLRMWMIFHVFEGFLSLFLCLFIEGIVISEQSDIYMYAQFSFEL